MFGISIIDLLVIAFYVFIVIWLGWRAKKKVSSSGDYFMGGRRGNKIMQVANALGAGTHTAQAIAVSGATYQIGLAGIWYQWLYLFSTPIYWLLAPIYRRLRYITIGDFFQERYGLKLASAYSVMGLLYFIGEVGLILKATSVSLEAISGGALSAEVIVILLTVFFLSYSVLGGLASALIINLLQGVLIVMLSFLIIPFALYAGGGISAMKAKLPEYMFSFVAPEEVTLFFIIMLIVNGLIGVSVLPHHMAINGSGKSEMNCRTGWTYGNFTKRFATLGWAFVGVFAAALFPGLSGDKREFAFGMAITNLLPVGLVGVMISAMIATVLAACHNYMVGGSALFTRNFYKRFTHHDSTEKEKLRVARISSLVVVVGGVTVALTIPTVVEGLKYIWQMTAFFGIAFWVGVMWKGANRYGVWASLITTIAASIYVGKYTPWSLGLPFEYQIAVYLPAGFLSLVIVSLFTKSEPESQLNKFFTLLHTPVGEEHKLNEKGIDMMLEGESVVKQSTTDGKSLEENGHSLLLVDLLSLKSKFSFKRYKIDIIGFVLAILFVIAILLFGIFISNIG
jgi:Na+/proline symporter